MKVEKCIKSSFTVIGKEGSTNDGNEFIQNLWENANSNFNEIEYLAKKNENGKLCGVWGAMSDFSRSFNPWENNFSQGLYLAGLECVDDAEAPRGWTKWLIFENTHESIVSQQEFELVQELRKNKRRPQKHEEVNPFSGMVYCADCGKKMYLCRSTSFTADQEHMKCSTYASDKDVCSAHFIRTVVLKEIVLNELNKLLATVKENEDEFVQAAMSNSVQKQSTELSRAKKTLKQAEKRIAELDKLFTSLYEDNVSGKISDERFAMMSAGYEYEQKELKITVTELTAYIETAEQKSADVTAFIKVVRKYEFITELTPEIIHELIERIVIHAPGKSSGHRTQQIDVYYRFDVAVSTAIADSRKYDKKRKAA